MHLQLACMHLQLAGCLCRGERVKCSMNPDAFCCWHDVSDLSSTLAQPRILNCLSCCMVLTQTDRDPLEKGVL